MKTPQGWKVRRVAGVDVAYDKNDDRLIAAVVVLDAETLKVVETAAAEGKPSFPYIPGLFSFRELPPVLEAFKRLKTPPDLIVCDGQGIAHPRRFGLANHLGLLLDIPTIGCGKTRLIGEYEEPDGERGSASPLIAFESNVGASGSTEREIERSSSNDRYPQNLQKTHRPFQKTLPL